jgi:hypothetical protein
VVFRSAAMRYSIDSLTLRLGPAQNAKTESALKEADAYIASQTDKNAFRRIVLVSIEGKPRRKSLAKGNGVFLPNSWKVC